MSGFRGSWLRIVRFPTPLLTALAGLPRHWSAFNVLHALLTLGVRGALNDRTRAKAGNGQQ
eukprot:11204609-Lingulodinium_polyedra.AAC.1